MNEMYQKKIDQVIDYICHNINHRISLFELMEVGQFSKTHFQRIFVEATGVTFNRFVKRLRMEKACRIIRTGQAVDLQTLALQLGYNSTANFSRDFKEYFGVSPRDVKNALVFCVKKRNEPTSVYPVKFDGVEVLSDQYVVYRKITSGYNCDEIVAGFESLFRSAVQYRFDVKRVMGIAYDDPDFTPAEKCIYDTCLVIEKSHERLPHFPYNFKTVSGGRYAVFSFEGKKEEVALGWNYIYGRWLVNSKWILDDAPRLEFYQHDEGVAPLVIRAKLYLPVRPMQ